MLPPWLQSLLNGIVRVYTALEGLIAGVVKPAWTVLGRIWSVVRPTRFSAFTILAGAILLFLTAQGRELAARFGDNVALDIAVLIVTVVWLATQSWYWARISLYFDYGTDRSKWPSVWISIIPRLYAGAAFAAAAGALWLADSHRAALFMAGAGVLYFLLLTYRTTLFAGIIAQTKPATKGARVEGFLDLHPSTVAVLVGSTVIALGALLVVSLWPVAAGQMMGATAAAFFAFGNLIPIGSFLIVRSREFGFPMILTLLLWALLISPLADNHMVPTVGQKWSEEGDKRPTVDKAFEAWLAAHDQQDGRPLPIVFVSTAGGGLRAAYWTATVLGRLQDTCPGFAASTFSISGVSGGSVGAAVFAARRADRGPAGDAGCRAEPVAKGDEAFMQKVLSGDFLGPTVAAMLFPDFLQRFIPYPFLPDRGNALSRSWEAGWESACMELEACGENAEGVGSTFLNAGPRPGGGWQPLLLLNGTHEETGKRIITGHVKVTGDTFLDAFDALHLLGKDMALATAALNSARFTYVSPAGRLVDADGNDRGHVLDGGYFENYGAVTTRQLLTRVARAAEGLQRRIKPIVIQIVSDPGLLPSDYPVAHDGFHPMEAEPHFFANEIAGPVLGLLHTRGARGVLANKTVAALVHAINADAAKTPYLEKAVFAHFELCPEDENEPPPLGWAMSKQTRERIGRLLSQKTERCDNPAELKRVIEALAR